MHSYFLAGELMPAVTAASSLEVLLTEAGEVLAEACSTLSLQQCYCMASKAPQQHERKEERRYLKINLSLFPFCFSELLLPYVEAQLIQSEVPHVVIKQFVTQPHALTSPFWSPLIYKIKTMFPRSSPRQQLNFVSTEL